MKYLVTFVFLTLSLIVISCGVKLKELRHGVNNYNINLEISPEDQFIKVTGSINYILPEPLCDSAVFYLHKDFKIKSISGSDVKEYKFFDSPDTSLVINPDARILLVRFTKTFDKGETTSINFEYSGRISDIHKLSQNIITKEWAEIGYGLPWFPYNFEHGEFTFELNVESPRDYKVRSSGNYEHENNIFKFISEIPVNDIPVFVSKNFSEKFINLGKTNINLYYTDIYDSTAEKLDNDLSWIINALAERYGNKDEKNLTVMQSLRDIGGSYSHLGIVSLSQLYDSTYFENREKYFKYLSYSAAKLWWWQAAHDWNDWMNEGFAEFSALLLIKEKFGEDYFEKLLTQKIDSVRVSTPVWMFNRNYTKDKTTQVRAEEILFLKSPVIIYQLYKKIGNERFNLLCREALGNDIASTKLFLSLLERREGKETANWFEQILKNY